MLCMSQATPTAIRFDGYHHPVLIASLIALRCCILTGLLSSVDYGEQKVKRVGEITLLIAFRKYHRAEVIPLDGVQSVC